MMRRLILIGGLTLLTTLSSISGVAQDLCESIVSNALALAESNCGGIADNLACYGYDSLGVTYYETDATTGVWASGSLVDVTDVQLIESSPVSDDGSAWGITYFQVVPDDVVLPVNEAIRVLVLGDMILENAPPPPDPAMGDFPATSGLSSGGSYLEEIYFSSSGTPSCLQAMNAIVVQTPRNITISMIVNSVPMTMNGTVILGQTTGTVDTPMFVTSIDGNVRIYPDTEQEIRLGQGEVSIAVLSTDTDPESEPIYHPLTGLPATDSQGQPILRRVPLTVFTQPLPLEPVGDDIWSVDYYELLGLIPSPLLNYPISVTLPPPVITRVYCTYGFNSYNETWDVRNIPPEVTEIVFFGGVENAVQPQPTVTILQNRPTQTVFGRTATGERVDLPVTFRSACPLPATATPFPTNTPLVTATTEFGLEPTSVAPETTEDAFSLTATQMIGDLTATAQPTANDVELTATALIGELTATAEILASSAEEATPSTHIVATGDTAYRIATEYGVTLEALLEANGIDDPNLIFIGQELVIP